ncbi:ABC transporter ATP-binding protein [Brevibacterium marinum]|uniref:Glutathione import ATP-binding protein GsiA n=1 Tax=Brevibacterium marinum TaxID=418643 RepID=A0A846S225_9MICO|nr:oligopeptide/dipeptide ABC transporter ATP-binding protein [Brevibacterium marinum]NJC57023.1 ABC-type glutathione transport system ATPase component [Brevibacterium marinum]
MTRILDVEHMVKGFSLSGGMRVHAVEDVTFHVDRAETLALVGESGCGKTTVANLAMRLQKPDSGTIRLLDTDITELRTRELRAHRRHLQMIFQDPFASLNPRKTVGKIVGDPMRLNRTASNSVIDSRVADLFELVGLSADDMRKYPHQFSGGQRQRICIARALTLNPSLIVADEAVSALDVSVRATVLNLMIELQQELELSYLFVSHDLAVVERIAHRVAVMYLGQIVEMGPRRQVFENPQHSYTQRLMDAAPIADPGQRRERVLIAGEIPSPVWPEDEGPQRVRLRDLGDDHLVAVE